jgi:hypothetical protein
MTVGNDLAFPYSKDKAERRKGFYADGDYKLNIANLRDEAKDELGWMGFTNLHASEIMPGTLLFDIEPMGTSKQLWLYKLWIETQVAVWAEQAAFQYYNCSESGILGLLVREYKTGDLMWDKDNWYLIDEILPERWRTRTLEQAFNEFIEVKLWQKQQGKLGILTSVGSAGGLPSQTDIVGRIVQNEKDRMTGSGIIH